MLLKFVSVGLFDQDAHSFRFVLPRNRFLPAADQGLEFRLCLNQQVESRPGPGSKFHRVGIASQHALLQNPASRRFHIVNMSELFCGARTKKARLLEACSDAVVIMNHALVQDLLIIDATFGMDWGYTTYRALGQTGLGVKRCNGFVVSAITWPTTRQDRS